MVKIRNREDYSDGSIDLQKWLSQMAKRRGQEIAEYIKNACVLSQIAGEDQPTFSGETCLRQGLAMADIVADLNMDQETIAAAVVYPSVQYDQLTLQDIQEELGKPVSKLVAGVEQMEAAHALYHYSGQYERNPPHLDNLRRMLLAIVDDVRVVIIKLAERVALMRNIGKLPGSIQLRLAHETMDIYAPLANRLGIGQLKWELEDLAFRYLLPDAYKDLAEYLDERRIDREKYIDNIVHILKEEIAKANIQNANIYGRAKHIWSIYRKMQRKNVGYHEIYDVSAVRVLVETVNDCYLVLGIVHSLWPHIPSEFDDYIANPKQNGYRSIHTAVHGPGNKNLEVQIRTFDMHKESELGVAAHWVYKEAGSQKKGYENKIALLRQLLEWQQNLATQNQTEDKVQANLFEDRIYVFTPAGDIVDLPLGATALDFAYHIHSELGHHCRGAKVNGKITPLTQPLSTGEKIEILTARNINPSRDWLNPQLGFLKTARARAKVHHWFKQQDYERHCLEGQTYLDKELRKLNLPNPDYAALAHQLKYKTPSDLFVALATHELKLTQILQFLPSQKTTTIGLTSKTTTPISISVPIRPERGDEINVLGVDHVLTHTARCCKPIPGDPIIGFITRGRGVTVHRLDCKNVTYSQKLYPERLIPVSWGQQELKQTYPVDIYITALDRPGLIRDITAIFANDKLSLTAINSRNDSQQNTHMITVTVAIADISLLEKIITRIQQLPDVYTVNRKY